MQYPRNGPLVTSNVKRPHDSRRYPPQAMAAGPAHTSGYANEAQRP